LATGNPRAAERWLLQTLSRHSGTPSEATVATLLGTAHAARGEYVSADRWFAKAAALRPDALTSAELAIAEAESLFARSRESTPEEQRAFLSRARKLAKRANLVDFEDLALSARSHALLGFISSAERDDKDAIIEFSAALHILEKPRSRDTILQARLVHALSVAEAETRGLAPGKLDMEASRVPWNPELIELQVQTIRHIGLAYQRRGAFAIAAERFTTSMQIAPNTGWSIFGLADCINLAMTCREPISAAAFVTAAMAIFQEISWSTTLPEQRESLLALALALGRLADGARAKAVFEAFVGADWSPERELALEIAGKARESAIASAARHHSAGMVAAAIGDKEAASVLLTTATNAWRELGYRWRSLEAETDLERHSQVAPVDNVEAPFVPVDSATWLTPETVRGGPPASSLLPRLSPRNSRILNMILSGLSDREIADRCNLSSKTVRNIAHELYGIFNVHRRSELIVKCMIGDRNIAARSVSTDGADD
jgi:DNA-binding CsgD family transcriptional regulator